MTTTVDDGDFDGVSNYRWYAHSCNGGLFYAVSNINGAKVYLHRLLLSPPKGVVVDHVNGNPLDNRRCNLRIVSYAENLRNSTRSTLGGTWYDKATGKWVARTQWDGTRIMLGRFQSRQDAAAAIRIAKQMLKDGASPEEVTAQIRAHRTTVSSVPCLGIC